ncbi:MAG TPA: helix-turn-helix transcriptional regulator [Thermomicrobiales bacterium]
MARPANHRVDCQRSPLMGSTSDNGTALGEWIRATRLAQGISQRELAARARLSRSYLCDIERGRGAQPSIATLDKLARALGASRFDVFRVAGILESGASRPGDDRERRLLACFRELSPSGQAAVERFARFLHAEEQRWIQPPLIETRDEAPPPARIVGPTLFDQVGTVSESESSAGVS